MTFGNTLFWIILGFLILNLVIGIRAAKGIHTIKDYVLGNKNYSTISLSLTYIATYIGGAVIFGDGIGSAGLITFFSLMGSCIADFLRASLLPGRMTKFRNCLTLGNMVGMLYGKEARVLTGFLGSLVSMIWVTIQLIVIGTICEKFLEINSTKGILVGGSIITIYSIHGGIKAVTATDILQFIMLFITMAILANVVVNEMGGIDLFINTVSETSMPPISDITLYTHAILFVIFLFFMSCIVDPAIMQRVLMAKSGKQIRDLFLTVGSIRIFFHILLLIISMGAIILYKDLPSSDVIQRLTTELVPKQLHGIVILGLFSIVASTADSCLHAAGVSFGLDLINVHEDNKIFYSKIGTLIVAVLAMFVAIMNINTFKYLGFRAYQIMSVTITCPLILGIFDVKPSKRAFWTACAVSVTACAILTYMLPAAYEPVATLISMIVNLIVFLIVHYIEFGKIEIVKNKYIIVQNNDKDDSFFLKRLLNSYLGSSAYSYKNPYILFGSVCIFNILSPLFMYGSFSYDQSYTILSFKLITIVLAILLVVHNVWHPILKVFLPIFYNLTITYALPFLGASMFMITGGKIECLTNFAISAMFLIMLVDHRAFFIHMILGVGLAWYVFGDYSESFGVPSISNANLYLISYQIIFVTVVGLLFLKDKLVFLNKTNYAKNFYKILENQKSKDLHKIESSKEKYYTLLGRREIDVVKKLDKAIELLNLNQKESLKKSLQETREYMAGLVKRSTEYMHLLADAIPMTDLVDALENTFSSLDGRRNVYVVNTSNAQHMTCDYIGLLRIMTYLLTKYQTYSVKNHQSLLQNILIYTSDSKLIYTVEGLPSCTKTVDSIKIILSSSDHLTTDILNNPCQTELSRAEEVYPVDEEDMTLPAVQRVVSAHYGKLLDYSTDDHCTFGVCLPRDVYSIRPATLDIEGIDEGLQIWQPAVDLEKRFLQNFHRLCLNISDKKVHSGLQIIKKIPLSPAEKVWRTVLHAPDLCRIYRHEYDPPKLRSFT